MPHVLMTHVYIPVSNVPIMNSKDLLEGMITILFPEHKKLATLLTA